MMDLTQPNHSIDIHIEELVLEGSPSRDTSRIASVVQSELEQLLRKRNITGSIRNGHVDQIDGGTIQIKPGATPEMTGRQIARNLYQGLIQ